jgi:Protein NO VEIN, C-terminal
LGLDALNERRTDIAAIHDELHRRHGTPLYLALTLYQSIRRGVEVGQGYLFKWPAALNQLFPSLRAIGQVTAGSPAEPWDTPSRPPATGARSAHRRRSDQRFNRAVESHAVAVAMAWYQARGYAVEDVGSHKSWDLEASRTGDNRRIEVKGSTSLRDAVDLTVNEVTNAREWSSTDLMVVDQIRLETDPNGLITTSGGRVRRWENWAPAEDSLFAVVLSHFLSVGGQTE